MRRIATFGCAVVMLSMGAQQSHAESQFSLVDPIALIVVSGNFCDYSLNFKALEKFVDDNLDASNLQLMGYLNDSMYNKSSDSSIDERESMNPAEKTIYCRSVTNSANHYGLIK